MRTWLLRLRRAVLDRIAPVTRIPSTTAPPGKYEKPDDEHDELPPAA